MKDKYITIEDILKYCNPVYVCIYDTSANIYLDNGYILNITCDYSGSYFGAEDSWKSLQALTHKMNPNHLKGLL